MGLLSRRKRRIVIRPLHLANKRQSLQSKLIQMWEFNSEQRAILKNINIVLVSPQSPENIGLASRVLKNTGFPNLSLVNPNLTPKAYETAKRAKDVLEKAGIYKTLEEALSNSHFTFGTTRRIRKYKFVYNFDDIKPFIISLAKKKKISILFGKEDFGLSQDELELCDSAFYLPADQEFPSYNLAQSCGIICYQIAHLLNDLYSMPFLELARRKDRDSLFAYLEEYLSLSLKGRKLQSTMYSLKRIFSRTHLTKNEVSLLKSLILKKKNKEG